MKLYYTVLEQETARRAENEFVVLSKAYVYVDTQRRVTDGMQRSQGPLMARSSEPRRRMKIIDESQSACLRATNTYLSEIPCNHNKTAAAAARRVRERAQFLTTNLFRFNCYVLRLLSQKSRPLLALT